jgi:SAM-dependent methyltransferase
MPTENTNPDLTRMYNNDLVLKEYVNDGKSAVISSIITRIHRLARLDQDKISVLDLGCANGELLRLIDLQTHTLGIDDRVGLHGLDYNKDSIQQAKRENGQAVTYFFRDLRQDAFQNLGQQFDLMVSVNTLHEVHSSYHQEDASSAKSKVMTLVGQLGQQLTERGTFIIYDGLALPKEEAQKQAKFKIKSEKLAQAFPEIIKQYKWRQLVYKETDGILEMNREDLQAFLSIFKYFQTELWPIESTESFFYFNQQEFRQMFERMGLKLDAYSVQNNDYGYWSENVELVDGSDFPAKTILMVGSKKYIPSGFNYFC